MYKIVFSKKSGAYLERLPREVSHRIYNKISSANENPFMTFDLMSGNGLYKLRVGDYRVIADIDAIDTTIYIRLIGHRKNVYSSMGRMN